MKPIQGRRSGLMIQEPTRMGCVSCFNGKLSERIKSIARLNETFDSPGALFNRNEWSQ
mgnify:CR=1 FL=1